MAESMLLCWSIILFNPHQPSGRRGSLEVLFFEMDISLQGDKQAKWQAYVDDALLKTGQVTDAAIYGIDGVKWAASKNLNVCIKSSSYRF